MSIDCIRAGFCAVRAEVVAQEGSVLRTGHKASRTRAVSRCAGDWNLTSHGPSRDRSAKTRNCIYPRPVCQSHRGGVSSGTNASSQSASVCVKRSPRKNPARSLSAYRAFELRQGGTFKGIGQQNAARQCRNCRFAVFNSQFAIGTSLLTPGFTCQTIGIRCGRAAPTCRRSFSFDRQASTTVFALASGRRVL